MANRSQLPITSAALMWFTLCWLSDLLASSSIPRDIESHPMLIISMMLNAGTYTFLIDLIEINFWGIFIKNFEPVRLSAVKH